MPRRRASAARPVDLKIVFDSFHLANIITFPIYPPLSPIVFSSKQQHHLHRAPPHTSSFIFHSRNGDFRPPPTVEELLYPPGVDEDSSLRVWVVSR